MAQRSEVESQYPKTVALAGGRKANVRLMVPEDKEAILAFARQLSEDDLLFLRTDITDPATIEEWIRNIGSGHTISLLAEIDGVLAAYASVHLNEVRWTRHLAELRITVRRDFRAISLGRKMTAEVFDLARRLGIRKIAAQMTPDQITARTVFERLGFQVEALLPDWVEDMNGRPRDLLVMAHDISGHSDQVVS